MKAAIVNTFGEAPAYGDFPDPVAGEGEAVLTVEAAPLSPIVKALAAGRHYASSGRTGFVPGVDGIGTDQAGNRVYFLFPRAPFGSMAQKSVVSKAMLVPVPNALPSDLAAAVATAGLASWVALTRRARIGKGQTVLVTGANGAAGRMALQVAKHLGAGKVIAVARSAAKLADVDAPVKVGLDEAGAEAGGGTLRRIFDEGVDIVLDFVWGEPASRILQAAAGNRGSGAGEPRLRYVQLGTVAGGEIPLRGDMLRSSGLELLGSGIGSVPVRELLAGAGELLAAAPDAGFAPPFRTAPLDAVTETWGRGSGIRYIMAPG